MLELEKAKLLILKKNILILKKKQLAKKKTRKYWVHPINLNRNERGLYHTLIQELRLANSVERHHKYLRMSAKSFDCLLELIKPRIVKQNTQLRKSIEPELKLAITIHHLAEGSTYQTIAHHYRLGKSTVSNIIYETCKAICDILQPLYMKEPQDAEKWLNIAEGLVGSVILL